MILYMVRMQVWDEVMSAKKKKKLKRYLIETLKVLMMLAFCALLGMYLAVGVRAGSAKRYAKKYFSYYVTNNYEEMYKMIDCRKTQFTSFENFKNKCEGEKIYGSVSGYVLSKPVKKGDTVTFVATYKVGSDPAEKTYTITLNKQKKKTYVFFNTWKVSVDRMTINNFRINVPPDTTVTLDGIDITSFKRGLTEDGKQDKYLIPHMFTGDHTATVNMKDSTISKTQYITQDMKDMTVTENDFALKPDVQKKIYDYSIFVVNSMYQYAMDATKNFDDISILYSSDEASQESARKTFETVSSGVVQENGASIRQLELKAVTPQITQFVYPDEVSVRVNYQYSFTAVSGTSALSGLVSEFSGEGSYSADVFFNLIDGDWKIVRMDMKCFDYKP